MLPNMAWKVSLVFLFGYKISIVTMFLSRNVTELSGFLSKSCMLLAKKYMYVTYINNVAWRIRSIHPKHEFLVSSNRKWEGFGSFLGNFRKGYPLKPRKYETIIIKLTDVLLSMSLLHGLGQHWITV